MGPQGLNTDVDNLTARERQAAVRRRHARSIGRAALTHVCARQEERSRLELHPQTSITLDHARLSVRYSEGITWVLTTDLGLADASLAEHLAAAVQVDNSAILPDPLSCTPLVYPSRVPLRLQRFGDRLRDLAGILVCGERDPPRSAARLRSEARRICCCGETNCFTRSATGSGATVGGFQVTQD
jgi:hypothetical protein